MGRDVRRGGYPAHGHRGQQVAHQPVRQALLERFRNLAVLLTRRPLHPESDGPALCCEQKVGLRVSQGAIDPSADVLGGETPPVQERHVKTKVDHKLVEEGVVVLRRHELAKEPIRERAVRRGLRARGVVVHGGVRHTRGEVARLQLLPQSLARVAARCDLRFQVDIGVHRLLLPARVDELLHPRNPKGHIL